MACSLLALPVGGQAQQDTSYFVKHLQFSGNESLEQKASMAARLVPSPQQLAWQQMELTAFCILELIHLPVVNGETAQKILLCLIRQNWMLSNGYVP